MNIYELQLTLKLDQDIHFLESYKMLSDCLNFFMLYNEDLQQLHMTKGYKLYCFSSLYPFEKSKYYQKNKAYTITIRSLDEKVVEGFIDSFEMKRSFKQFTIVDYRKKVKKDQIIKELVSITPAIMVKEKGYWTINDGITDLKDNLQVNLQKKLLAFNGKKFNDDNEVIKSIELMNRIPIKVPYKGVFLLGNKVRVKFHENVEAQELATIGYGAGILEKNSLGFGFCLANY